MNDEIELTFQNTRQDILHGCRYITKTAPSSKKRELFKVFLMFIGVLLINTFVSYRHDAGIFYLLITTPVIFVALLGMAWLYSRLVFEYSIRSNTPKTDESGVLGQHHLTITPEWVIERTHINETKFAWRSVPRVDEDAKYMYVRSLMSPKGGHAWY